MFQIQTGSLVSTNDLISGNIPRISAKSENNGILGYFDTSKIENARHCKNFISVNFFGSDGGIFYHPYEASIEMKVHTLKIPDHDFNPRTGVFIASALKMSLNNFGYGSQLSSSKLKELEFIIQLPVKNGKIDFEFIEEFIAELEAERIAELEAYLVATGLKDYELTKEEQQVLDYVENGTIKFSEYNIDDLFEIRSYKKRFDANKVDISKIGYPYIVRTGLNNGVRGYITEDIKFLNEENTISFGQDTATMFYQEQPYFTGDKIKIIKSKSKLFNKNNAHFFITGMKKAFSSFSWGSASFNVNIIKNQKIKLPTKNNQPDYITMETFISAIQKLVIKDVVLYADSKILATKQVCE